MREALVEATATVEQLRDVATSMIGAYLTDLMAGSFMDGMSLEKRLQLHDELHDKLSGLGATADQLRSADVEWRKGISVIYHRIISNEIIRAIEPSDIVTRNQLVSETQSLLDFPNWIAAQPSAFEQFATRHQALTPAVQGWIDDYHHFLQSNELRRRHEFIKG
jgi:hypothetical protein